MNRTDMQKAERMLTVLVLGCAFLFGLQAGSHAQTAADAPPGFAPVATVADTSTQVYSDGGVGTMPTTGGEPFLMMLMGSTTALGALSLRRRLK